MAGPTKIRVMIVDDIRESRDNVAKLLRFESDVEVVGTAENGQEAIDLALKIEPDIILMDINMPGVDGITATTRIVSRLPNTAVIMMSVQNEADYLRRAMLAGAREFLSKPFSLDELIQSIRHVNQLAQANRRVMVAGGGNASTESASARSKRGKLVTVFSLKGGVGRSTVACNLAISMKALGNQDVTLMDANLLYGDLGVMMNVSDNRTIADTVKHFQTMDRDLISDLRIAHSSGVKVILAPATPQLGEQVTIDHIRQMMGLLVTMTDFIVIDTRPSFDDITLSLLDQSDYVILVLSSELTAVKGAKQYLEVSDLLGYDTDRVMLVVNRSTAPGGIPVHDVATSLRGEIVAALPDVPELALRAINEGVPMVQSAPNSVLAAEIAKLAKVIVGQSVVALDASDVPATSASTTRMSRWMKPPARRRAG